MARRFEQMLRVKPRDNLGDPEYWNRRFEDLDRRIDANEGGLSDIGSLTAHIEGLALDRLNLVLNPALSKIALVSQEGFLLAHSVNSVTLTVGSTVTFNIHIEAEREIFTPSPFVAITREAVETDYAVGRLISYSKVTGDLVVELLQCVGDPGPFTDWVITVGAGVSLAVEQMLSAATAARDQALVHKNAAAASAAAAAADRTAVANDKTTVASDKATVVAAKDAALDAAADAAQSAADAAAATGFDPNSYYTKSETDTALAAKEATANKGAAGGYASLDGSGKIPTSQLPAAILGALNWQGLWNATTNSPAIPAASSSNKGYYYKVSVAGTTNVSGITDWQVGDWIVSNGTSWDKVDNTDLVVSVAGKTGAVTLTAGDISDASADGRSLFQAATYQAMRTLLGLATVAVSGAYNDLTGKPTLGTGAAKNITVSTADPSGGVDGDIWIKVL
jgi:hypothetical protein